VNAYPEDVWLQLVTDSFDFGDLRESLDKAEEGRTSTYQSPRRYKRTQRIIHLRTQFHSASPVGQEKPSPAGRFLTRRQ
jgi:hypothetical protein